MWNALALNRIRKPCQVGKKPQWGGINLADTFLFVGTILVAFQIVSDIGYIATFFSMPFALPILPLMKKIGLSFKRVSRIKIKFQIDKPSEKIRSNRLSQVIWWILFILSVLVFSVVTIATQPIMIAYTLVCRPLLAINKLMNFIYRKTVSQWILCFCLSCKIMLTLCKKS